MFVVFSWCIAQELPIALESTSTAPEYQNHVHIHDQLPH